MFNGQQKPIESESALLLMEEIPNNHLECIKPVVNNGIDYQPQLVIAGFLPPTVSLRRQVLSLPTFVISKLKWGLAGRDHNKILENGAFHDDSFGTVLRKMSLIFRNL